MWSGPLDVAFIYLGRSKVSVRNLRLLHLVHEYKGYEQC